MSDITISEQQASFVKAATTAANFLLSGVEPLPVDRYNTALRALADAAEYLAQLGDGQISAASAYPKVPSVFLATYEQTNDPRQYVDDMLVAYKRSHSVTPPPLSGPELKTITDCTRAAIVTLLANPQPGPDDINSAANNLACCVNTLLADLKPPQSISLPHPLTPQHLGQTDIIFVVAAAAAALDFLASADHKGRDADSLINTAITAYCDAINILENKSVSPMYTVLGSPTCLQIYQGKAGLNYTQYAGNPKAYIACLDGEPL